MSTQVERVYSFVQHKKRCTRYEVEEFFRNMIPGQHISAEVVNVNLRILRRQGRIQHPTFMGEINRSSYEVKP